jgi:hypothetical protein
MLAKILMPALDLARPAGLENGFPTPQLLLQCSTCAAAGFG